MTVVLRRLFAFLAFPFLAPRRIKLWQEICHERTHHLIRQAKVISDQAAQLDTMRAHLLTLRVSQAVEIDPRTGWEVSAYMPKEVCDKLVAGDEKTRAWYVREVAMRLVASALKGLVRVHPHGKVNALIFTPVEVLGGKVQKPQSQWAAAVFEDGHIGRAELVESEEARVRRISR